MADESLNNTAGYPVDKRMSARYEGTFAYVTVKDRMPRILTQVIDTVHKEEGKMKEQYGEAGTEDVKSVLSQLSELRYQLETNKPIIPIKHGEDAKEWETAHETYRQHLGSDPLWYRVSWLFAECYMYRRIAEIFQTSAYMKDFDPFSAQKESTFVSSLPQITAVAKYLNGALSKPNVQNQDIKDLRTEFEHLLLLCLWGNKIDLSMAASVDEYDTTHEAVPLHRSDSHEAQRLRTNVLADHSTALWELMKLIQQPKSDQSVKRRIDFVLDNAGYEIFADVAFADWLLSVKLADQVHFHCKKLPWFVSDALIKDLSWTIEQLGSNENKILSDLGKKWKSRIEDGTFVVSDHPFWTTSYEYTAMKNIAPDLYSLLSESFLIIFKGDLNYRKLLADRNWHYTQDFSIALGGFQPTNVCALRTLKADLVTGLPPGVAEKAARANKDWMITGQYAVLQVHNTAK